MGHSFMQIRLIIYSRSLAQLYISLIRQYSVYFAILSCTTVLSLYPEIIPSHDLIMAEGAAAAVDRFTAKGSSGFLTLTTPFPVTGTAAAASATDVESS